MYTHIHIYVYMHYVCMRLWGWVGVILYFALSTFLNLSLWHRPEPGGHATSPLMALSAASSGSRCRCLFLPFFHLCFIHFVLLSCYPFPPSPFLFLSLWTHTQTIQTQTWVYIYYRQGCAWSSTWSLPFSLGPFSMNGAVGAHTHTHTQSYLHIYIYIYIHIHIYSAWHAYWLVLITIYRSH